MGKKKGELMEDYGGKDEKSEGFEGKWGNLVEEKVRLVVEWGGGGTQVERENGRRAVEGERRRKEKKERRRKENGKGS